MEFCGAYRLVGWFVGEAFPAACGQTSWWSHEVVSKIYIPLITLHSVLIPGCCSPSHSFALQSCTSWFNILDEVRKKWSFLAVCCTAGEARCSLTHFHFLPWKKSQAKKFSLNADLCHLGGGVMWVKINCSSYLLQWVQSQIFLSNSVLQLLCYIPGLPKRPSCPRVIVKTCVLWGEDGRKLLYWRFDDITL